MDFTNIEVAIPEESGPREESMQSTAANSWSTKERMEYEYLKRRDPLKEFFQLVSFPFP